MHVVVMGGTSGIGLATARRFVADGAEVTVTGRDPVKLAAVKDEVGAAEQLDGTDEAAVGAFFEGIGAFEHLVLAFSPGPVGLGPVAGLDLADLRTALEGKLVAYLGAIRRARATESVTLVSAATARLAMAGTVALTAVNGAVERIVSPLAAELAPVRVNAVSPGAVETPWWSFLPEQARREQFEAAAAGLPAGRVGQPEDVAGAIAYLAHAPYVTGSVVPVDGGLTMA